MKKNIKKEIENIEMENAHDLGEICSLCGLSHNGANTSDKPLKSPFRRHTGMIIRCRRSNIRKRVSRIFWYAVIALIIYSTISFIGKIHVITQGDLKQQIKKGTCNVVDVRGHSDAFKKIVFETCVKFYE